MDAIHIIITGYFATNLRKIVRRSIIFRIHISIRSDFPNQPREPTTQRLTPQGIPLAYRNCNYPCMTFHTPFVTLLYRKLQSIITRTFSRKTRQTTIPRLISRRIDHRATYSGLNKHRINVRFLQTIQNLNQFLLLFFGRISRLRIGMRPVDTANRGQPHSTHLMLWGIIIKNHTLQRTTRRGSMHRAI